jgi:L-alanine-DL-glutamate epimerase-like enolase superfamily enzyme
MFIKSIEITNRNIPLKKPFKTALRTVTNVENIEVFIKLENGITGKGSATPTWAITGESVESIKEAISNPIRNVIENQNIYDFSNLLDKIENSCVDNSSAKAAVDIALHDAYCQLFKIPLNTYLGGSNDLNTFITIGVDTPEKMAEASQKHIQQGFMKLKVKVGDNPDIDLKRIEAIDKVISNDTQLLLDANQGWDAKTAIKVIKKMETITNHIKLVEQPVLAKDLEGLKRVTNHVGLPIMADESVFTPRDAMKLVNGAYVDLLNIKLMKCGGLRNARKIASIAEVAGVKCMIGSMMEDSYSVAVAAHLASAHPNIIYYDLDAPLWLNEAPKEIKYDKDKVIISQLPGVNEVHP